MRIVNPLNDQIGIRSVEVAEGLMHAKARVCSRKTGQRASAPMTFEASEAMESRLGSSSNS